MNKYFDQVNLPHCLSVKLPADLFSISLAKDVKLKE